MREDIYQAVRRMTPQELEEAAQRVGKRIEAAEEIFERVTFVSYDLMHKTFGPH